MEIFFHHLFAMRADPVVSLTRCARDKYAGDQRKQQISTHRLCANGKRDTWARRNGLNRHGSRVNRQSNCGMMRLFTLCSILYSIRLTAQQMGWGWPGLAFETWDPLAPPISFPVHCVDHLPG